MSEDPGEGSGEDDGVEVGEPGIAMLIGRQLAWAGEHVTTINVASHALKNTSLGSARLIVISG